MLYNFKSFSKSNDSRTAQKCENSEKKVLRNPKLPLEHFRSYWGDTQINRQTDGRTDRWTALKTVCRLLDHWKLNSMDEGLFLHNRKLFTLHKILERICLGKNLLKSLKFFFMTSLQYECLHFYLMVVSK